MRESDCGNVHTIIIEGSAVPISRPKANFYGGHINFYLPTTSRAWENQVKETVEKWIADNGYVRPTGITPFSMTIELYLPIPQCQSSKKKLALIGEGNLYPNRGDLDNYAKGVMDGFGFAGFWFDDSEVVELTVSKRYSDTPRVVVRIMELGGSMAISKKCKKNMKENGEFDDTDC